LNSLTARVNFCGQSLTGRATLTFVASVMSLVVRSLSSLLATPYILSGLGSAQTYGVWVALQQAITWTAVVDLRPGGTLKLTLATAQHSDDWSEKRRQVGAAIALWWRCLPINVIAIALGALLVPTFIGQGASARMVAVSFVILACGAVLERRLSIGANALRGSNRDYWGLWGSAGITGLSAVASAAVARSGFGIVALAGVATGASLVASAYKLAVARARLQWFGVEQPSRSELGRFTQLSGWVLVGSASWACLFASDAVAIATLLGPKAAAQLATTGFLLRIASEPVALLLSAMAPGSAGIVGARKWDALNRVRQEAHALAIGAGLLIAIPLMVLNKVFVSVWVGPDLFGGTAVTALLALATGLTLLCRTEAVVMDSALQFKSKALVLATGVGAFTATAYPLCEIAGVAGFVMSTLFGRLVAFWGLRLMATRAMPTMRVSPSRWPVGAAALLVAGFLFERMVAPQAILTTVLAAAASTCITAILFWAVVLTGDIRASVKARTASILNLLNSQLFGHA
jgi:O-antigen/teichoic acid export membrane protein